MDIKEIIDNITDAIEIGCSVNIGHNESIVLLDHINNQSETIDKYESLLQDNIK